MGKRELLLIVGFAIVGMVAYQATAPPSDPTEPGLSISRLLEQARREIRGNRASAVRTTTSTLPIGGDVTELRISEYVREVHVSGEDRPDAEVTLHVVSNAYDDEEAGQTAEQTVLVTDRAASSVLLRVAHPRAGRQRATLTLKVPARLDVRIESRPDILTLTDVAAVDATNAGGETTIRRIAGRVAVTHRGGPVVIEDVESVRFTGRNSRLTLDEVRGDTSIVMEQGGTVATSRLAGPLELDTRQADITLDNLETTSGPIRVNANGGSVSLARVRSEARLDGRNATLDVVMSGPAPVAIYSTGGGVSLTPPPGAYTLDIVTTQGRITPDTALAALGVSSTTQGDPQEERVTGAVGGGGPTITIRVTRADVVLRPPAP